jgi:hypothetical protein
LLTPRLSPARSPTTAVATDGPKLTIEFDDGGVKRVLGRFVVRSDEAPAMD